jgi:hypothetical protein
VGAVGEWVALDPCSLAGSPALQPRRPPLCLCPHPSASCPPFKLPPLLLPALPCPALPCPALPPSCSVMIFEATEPGFPADQAVRIFVQFERVEAATKVGQAGWMGGWARVGGACWGRAAGVCKPLCIRAPSVEPRLPHVSEPLVLSLASPMYQSPWC